MEYHGKSVVDGHFGVLSRWHRDGEASRDLTSLDELLRLFREKACEQRQRGGNNSDTVFDVYSRDTPRGMLPKLVVPNFRSYLSFILWEGTLWASTLSTLNYREYTGATYRVKVVRDRRSTKYAPTSRRTDVEVP